MEGGAEELRDVAYSLEINLLPSMEKTFLINIESFDIYLKLIEAL
jgi:hypothetical protein